MKRKQETTTTIEQAFTGFITDKSLKGVSQPTLSNYRISYKVFCATLGLDPSTPFEDITQSTVNTFISIKLKELKPVSLNHYLRDIRTWLNHYDRDIKVNMIQHPEIKIEGYTDEEVKILISTPKKLDNYAYWKSWLIACIVLGTGARIGSVVSLHKSDVDYTNKVIHFPHTKNGKDLTLPLTDPLIKCLRTFESTWDNNTEWLIPNYDGSQSTSHGCLESFNKYCIFVQIEQKGLHALRHTFARLSIENGMDIYTLNRYLGHSDIRMTEHYINIYGAKLSTTNIPLDKLLKPAISRK